MPMQLGSRIAVLTGIVTIDETEALADWLRTRSSAQTPARVHLGTCTHLHSAALQVLLAGQVQVSVAPTDPFLLTWVAPLLDAAPRKATGAVTDPAHPVADEAAQDAA